MGRNRLLYRRSLCSSRNNGLRSGCCCITGLHGGSYRIAGLHGRHLRTQGLHGGHCCKIGLHCRQRYLVWQIA
jgi:hypothetical protein